MHAPQLRLHGSPGIDLQAFFENLDGFGGMAFEIQFVGDRDVFAHRFRRRTLFRIDIGEARPGFEIGGIDLDHPPQGFRGFLEARSLQLVFGDDLILPLRLHDQTLLGVEVGQLRVRFDHGRVEFVDLLPDRDGLQVEAVLRVELGDFRVLVAGLAHLSDLREQVADLVDRVPVARIVLEKQAEKGNRLFEFPRLFGLFGLLAGLNRVDLGQGGLRFDYLLPGT